MPVCGGLGFIHTFETISTILVQPIVRILSYQCLFCLILTPIKIKERSKYLVQYSSNHSLQIVTPRNSGRLTQYCCKLPTGGCVSYLE